MSSRLTAHSLIGRLLIDTPHHQVAPTLPQRVDASAGGRYVLWWSRSVLDLQMGLNVVADGCSLGVSEGAGDTSGGPSAEPRDDVTFLEAVSFILLDGKTLKRSVSMKRAERNMSGK